MGSKEVTHRRNGTAVNISHQKLSPYRKIKRAGEKDGQTCAEKTHSSKKETST